MFEMPSLSVLLYSDVDRTTAVTYYDRLVRHIDSVQTFGMQMGDIDLGQLHRHDSSKWFPDEFVPYAKRFCSDLPEEVTAAQFAHAWMLHLHRNPHHWQHWMFPDGFSIDKSGLENGVLPMPHMYALEMIADWHGAGFAYNQSWDISEWLSKNMGKITLHSETAAFVRNRLSMLGYDSVVLYKNWANER